METTNKKLDSYDHEKLKQFFIDAEDSTVDSRRLSERDADYYDGKQLTAKEYQTLAKRKQPPVINNRIKPKIDFMLGLELKTRTDPKAFPRNQKTDEDSANACTDALRYVCDTTDFDRVKSLCYEDGLKYGTYGAQVVVKPKGNGYDITLVHVPWDRIFYDPHSRAKNFSDAKYKGVVIWMDKADAEEMWSGKNLSNADSDTNSTDTFGDKPQDRWVDAKRDRIRIIYIEYLYQGTWHFCYMTGADFLEEPKPLPFTDDQGESVSSLVFQSLFVDRDGNRYGQVRQYIDMQDEINKRRSKGLHLLNNRQTIGEKGAVDDVNKMKAEFAKPDGHIEVTPGLRFDPVPTNDMAAGNWQMLQEAKAEIDAQGPNASMVGAEKRDLSGRAIQALQSGGNIETSIQTDGLRDWEHRIYRLIWYCIKKYWTSEKWFRVTDDENAPKYVGLNVPTTAGEQFIEKAKAEGQELDEGILAQLANSPDYQRPEIKNNVAELDVDIILEDVPDTVTIQQEQFQQLTQLYPAVPEPIKPLAFELLIEASSIRNKRRFIDKLQGKGEQPQQPDPMQQQHMQMQMAKMQAEIDKLHEEVIKTKTESIKNLALAEAAEIGPQLEQYKLEMASLQQPPQQNA